MHVYTHAADNHRTTPARVLVTKSRLIKSRRRSPPHVTILLDIWCRYRSLARFHLSCVRCCCCYHPSNADLIRITAAPERERECIYRRQTERVGARKYRMQMARVRRRSIYTSPPCRSRASFFSVVVVGPIGHVFEFHERTIIAYRGGGELIRRACTRLDGFIAG